eukprot:Gb_05051 [translate_table: standard]
MLTSLQMCRTAIRTAVCRYKCWVIVALRIYAGNFPSVAGVCSILVGISRPMCCWHMSTESRKHPSSAQSKMDLDAVSMVLSISDAEAAAKRLTEEAYVRGSADNITCVVALVLAIKEASALRQQGRKCLLGCGSLGDPPQIS